MPAKKKERFSSGRVITYALCSLFLMLTVLFFSPLEVVLLNIRDFRFSFANIWYVQLSCAVVLAGLLTLITAMLPGRAGTLFAALQAGAGLAFWLQIMFLNGGMMVLTGETIEITTGRKIINALIWFIVIAGFFCISSVLKRKQKLVHTVLRAVSGGLIAVQCVALISLVAGTDIAADENNWIFTAEGQLDFASETNVITIVLDTADGEVTGEMLKHYPELYDSLSGWTYYPNAVSTYSRTYPALIYMLTGVKGYYDMDPEEYADSAFTGSDFLQTMKEKGTDVRVFSNEAGMIGKEGMKLFENARDTGNERDNLAYFQLEKNLIRISLYKGMPYVLKNLFQYKLDIINLSSFNYRPYMLYMDPFFYKSLQANGGVNVSDQYKNAFRFYHFWSLHPGSYWGSDLEVPEKLVDYETLRGSFLMLEEFIKGLKEAGIYDRSLIIVTADHGFSGGDDRKLARNRAACPVMMVKYPSSDTSRPLVVSKAPVSHEDLFETIYSGFSFDGKTEYGSGKKLQDFQEGDDRIRMHYYTALDRRNEEVAMVEYRIEGDATDFSNWSKTGKYWDILYSFNTISSEKYQEVMDALAD